MAYFYIKKGVRVYPGTPFTYNEMNYVQATDEIMQELGFKQVNIDPRPDDKYYFVNSQPNDQGQWDAQPRDLDELKKAEVAQIKATCASLLAPTDWQFIRQLETGDSVSPEVAEYRKQVRSCNNANEDTVNKCNSIEDLQNGVLIWPEVADVIPIS